MSRKFRLTKLRIPKRKMKKHKCQKKTQTQQKKDADESQNVSASGAEQDEQGKKLNPENMPVNPVPHAEKINYHYMKVDDITNHIQHSSNNEACGFLLSIFDNINEKAKSECRDDEIKFLKSVFGIKFDDTEGLDMIIKNRLKQLQEQNDNKI